MGLFLFLCSRGLIVIDSNLYVFEYKIAYTLSKTVADISTSYAFLYKGNCLGVDGKI